MPSFTAHISQANNNLKALETLTNNPEFWDWKVTIAFYTSLHFINAHIADSIDEHYHTHIKTSDVIGPDSNMPAAKVDINTAMSYRKLLNLSRRSRYLALGDDNNSGNPKDAYYTYEKHFGKALRHLDTIIKYIKKKYPDAKIDNIDIKCSYVKQSDNFATFSLTH